MEVRSATSALFISLVVAALVSGCTQENTPIAAVGPEAPYPAVDQHLVGVWYQVGSNEGFKFDAHGNVYRLTVDNQKRLQIDADEAIGQFVTVQEGEVALSWAYLTQSAPATFEETFKYALTDHDSTLRFRWLDFGSDHELVYVRKAIGEEIQVQ